jgi:hypothetical protein
LNTRPAAGPAGIGMIAEEILADDQDAFQLS